MAEGRSGILKLALLDIAQRKMEDHLNIVHSKQEAFILDYNVDTNMPIAFMLRIAHTEEVLA